MILSRTLGIINITPDSFSDGGIYNRPEDFQARVLDLWRQGVGIIDIGAESSAPFNQALSWKEEWERIQAILLPFLSGNLWPQGLTLSLDTYHPETFLEFSAWARQKVPHLPLIWNDVSGLLDDDVMDILTCRDSNCLYIFGHTFVPDRGAVLDHMKFAKGFLSPQEFLGSLQEHFVSASHTFFKAGLSERVFFDPCFGFSKTREQNLFLLKNCHQLFSFPSFFPRQKWCLGISRKSFLRPPDLQKSREETVIKESEKIHAATLAEWMHHSSASTFFFRVHDPEVILLAESQANDLQNLKKL